VATARPCPLADTPHRQQRGGRQARAWSSYAGIDSDDRGVRPGMACPSAKHPGQQDERAGMLHTANIARRTAAPHGRIRADRHERTNSPRTGFVLAGITFASAACQRISPRSARPSALPILPSQPIRSIRRVGARDPGTGLITESDALTRPRGDAFVGHQEPPRPWLARSASTQPRHPPDKPFRHASTDAGGSPVRWWNHVDEDLGWDFRP
jgi:hypothetical protein